MGLYRFHRVLIGIGTIFMGIVAGTLVAEFRASGQRSDLAFGLLFAVLSLAVGYYWLRMRYTVPTQPEQSGRS